MLKKRFALVLVVFALVAAACGDDDGGATTTAAPSDATTTAAPTTMAPTTMAPTTMAPTTTMADSGLPDLGGRTVTVGVENAYLPFNYIPLDGTEGEGWDYDTWQAICDLLNCVPDFVEAGWPAVIDEVAQGQLDTAADGISITDERKEVVAFSDPYMVVQQKFIVLLDDDRFTLYTDITGNEDVIIGTQVGTTNYELAASLVNEDRIQAYDQFGLAIQALIAGDVDAVIIDDAAGLGYVGENADLIKTIDDPLQSDPLGFIYPLGSDLVEPVNLALAELAANGTLEELGRTYFTDAFTLTYDDIAG